MTTTTFSSSPAAAFHLLEITIISAQDLHRRSRKVRAYATACVDQNLKLRTQVDPAGHTSPTWNDKFVFKVDDAFLLSDTSSIEVTIHAARGSVNFMRRQDPVLGVARIVVSTVLGTPPKESGRCVARKAVALQVRRPRTLEPQGILNVAIAVIDKSSRSAPLYYAAAPEAMSAFALNDLMATRSKSFPQLERIIKEEGGELQEENEETSRRVVEMLKRMSSSTDYSGPLETSRSRDANERRALESKIEKWKIEMSPDPRDSDRSKGRRGKAWSWSSSCFPACG